MGRTTTVRGLATICLLLATLGACRSAPEAPESKVLVIGIDGAEWKVLEPLIARGRLPNFARLMARGSYGNLETIEPILSPIIWTTIATGRKPEEHGITWFMERDPKTGQSKPVTSRLRKTTALWNIASEAGKKVGVVGWWATWPAESVNGWVISDHVAAHGFGLTAKAVKTELGRTHPPELADQITPFLSRPSQIPDDEILQYMQIDERELATRRGDRMQFSNPLHHFTFALSAHKTYQNLSRHMLLNLEPDLGMVYFEATDSLSHLFMKYTDPPMAGLDPKQQAKFKNVVPKIYERQDKVLGDLVAAAGPNTNIVIVSDHGFKTGDARLDEAKNTQVKHAHLWHTKQGVIVMAGPRVRQGVRLSASIYDVTPTVLSLLGLPVGRDMSGRILLEALTDEHLELSPPQTIPTHERPIDEALEPDAIASQPDAPAAAEIDPEVVERLRALGYVDTGATPEIFVNRARSAMDNGDATQARSILSELFATSPNYPDGLALMAALEIQQGNAETALRLFDQASEGAKPAQQAGLRRGRGSALLRLERYDEAMKTFSELTKSSDVKANDHYLLGLAQEGSGNLAGAQKSYETATSMDAEHAEALNNLASLHIRQDRLAIAEGLLRRSLNTRPHNSAARFNLGLLEERRKKPGEAMALFLETAQKDSSFAPARWALAVRYANSRDYPAAERWVGELVRLQPKRLEAWMLRASVAAATGRRADALRFFETAVAIDAQRAHNGLANEPQLRAIVSTR